MSAVDVVYAAFSGLGLAAFVGGMWKFVASSLGGGGSATSVGAQLSDPGAGDSGGVATQGQGAAAGRVRARSFRI
jgi:hypothetical protein